MGKKEEQEAALERWRDYLAATVVDDLLGVFWPTQLFFEGVGRGMPRPTPTSPPRLGNAQIEELQHLARLFLPGNWLSERNDQEEERWHAAIDAGLGNPALLKAAADLLQSWGIDPVSDAVTAGLMLEIDTFRDLAPNDVRAISWAEQLWQGFETSYLQGEPVMRDYVEGTRGEDEARWQARQSGGRPRILPKAEQEQVAREMIEEMARGMTEQEFRNLLKTRGIDVTLGTLRRWRRELGRSEGE